MAFVKKEGKPGVHHGPFRLYRSMRAVKPQQLSISGTVQLLTHGRLSNAAIVPHCFFCSFYVFANPNVQAEP